jgi:hypothetical protein
MLNNWADSITSLLIYEMTDLFIYMIKLVVRPAKLLKGTLIALLPPNRPLGLIK